MIVKHFNGYSSIGMTKESRCTTAEGLREQARKMIDAFGGALIEVRLCYLTCFLYSYMYLHLYRLLFVLILMPAQEFIDGREFTVLVAENPENPSEPIAYQPVECIFPKGESFKHFDLKVQLLVPFLVPSRSLYLYLYMYLYVFLCLYFCMCSFLCACYGRLAARSGSTTTR